MQKEKKLVAFIGSRRGHNSNGERVIREFLELEYWKDYSVTIISANELQIKQCQGCNQCFQQGYCVYDKLDDMGEIKEKLIDADLILVYSPVFVHNVNAATKNFIDRIAAWTHIFRLIGKRVIVCSGSSGNGDEFVIAYLRKVMISMGACVIGQLIIHTDKKDYSNEYEQLIQRVKNSYERPDSCKIASWQNELFHVYKEIYMGRNDLYEARYWEENRMFDYSNFKEFFYARLLQ